MDFTLAVARLLSDSDLRTEYYRDPRETARRLLICEHDLDTFLSIDPPSLESQSVTLLNKRLHEVSKILPETYSRLGQNVRKHFLDYAQKYWPKGHRRQLIDASNFCRYLIELGVDKVSRTEFNPLQATLSRRSFSIHLVPDLLVNGRLRRASQILYLRRNGSLRQLALYFGL